jgi:cell division protein FtsB
MSTSHKLTLKGEIEKLKRAALALQATYNVLVDRIVDLEKQIENLPEEKEVKQ